MVGFQERTEAAAKAFRESKEYSTLLWCDVVKSAVDPKTGPVVHINGAGMTATIPLGMIPLAVGEAIVAFIKPPKSPPASA